MSQRIADEAKIWLDRLQHESERDRLQAASELNRMRIRARGTVEARGSLSQAAWNKVGPGQIDAVKGIQAALHDPSPVVRREVAAALGEWGDATVVHILCSMVKKGSDPDPDAPVRRACVRALGTIGGPVAVEGLCAVAEHDLDEAVRRDAINALAELALQEPPMPREVRTTLGYRGRSPKEQVSMTLKRISLKEGKEYLRRKARVGLSILGDI